MWEAIRSNRLKSYFIFAMMALLLLVLGAVIGGAWFGEQGLLLGLLIAGVVWLVMAMIALVAGSNILLAFSGAREVKHEDAPQLFNIVEEMQIAASLPKTPRVYIMESRAPNAFAVGTPNASGVAVTTGLLSVLTRDELQGVIAHEIGHIRNLDSKFMTQAGVMMGTIVILSDVFVRSIFYGSLLGGRRRSRSNDGGGQLQMILMVVGIILAILAPVLAHLLYLACSRSREYLADASAAIFTRYPEGLASALEKISGAHIKLESANRVTAPMYIINPLSKAAGGSGGALFSTHPPITERVKILRLMGSAGLGEYNRAYNATMGKSIVGETTLRSSEELAMRGIKSPDADHNRKRQTREANDILLKLNQFLFIPCGCGLKIKVPPNFNSAIVKCPRCSLEHPLSQYRGKPA